MKRRFGAAALCLALLFSLSLSALAASEGDAVEGRVTGRAVARGDRAAVTVELAEDTGTVWGSVSVTYDTAVYTLVCAEAGEAASGEAETADGICELNTNEEDGVVSVLWVKGAPDTAGGLLISLLLEEIPAEDDEEGEDDAPEDVEVETDVDNDEPAADGEDEEDTDPGAPITVTVNRLSDTYNGSFSAEEGDDCFELIPADRTGLAYLCRVAAGLTEAEDTEEGRADLAEALSAAEEVLADEDAAREEIDAARLALAEALFARSPEFGTAADAAPAADRDVLAALLAEALELDEADYNRASWSDLADAAANARAVLAEEDATQEELNAAAFALLEAVMSLEEAVFGEPEELTEAEETGEPEEPKETDEGDGAPADAGSERSDLEQTYETAAGFDPADYTEESWSDLAAAMARADAVLNNETSTPGDDDGALAALLAAIVGLENAEDAEVLTQTVGVNTDDESQVTLASVLVGIGLLAICGLGYFLRRKHR